MGAIRVAVVNWTHLRADQFIGGAGALQRQLQEQFGPAWGIDAEIELIPADRLHGRESPWKGYWGLVLLDNGLTSEDSDRGRALGVYGDQTFDGFPLARVVYDNLYGDQQWTHLASHELLEMLVDPDGTGAVWRESAAAPLELYARRVCDPCAAYSDGYKLLGWQVSDFVHPAWFDSAVAGAADKLDQSHRITGRFEILPGGSGGPIDLANPQLHLPHRDAGKRKEFSSARSAWPP